MGPGVVLLASRTLHSGRNQSVEELSDLAPTLRPRAGESEASALEPEPART